MSCTLSLCLVVKGDRLPRLFQRLRLSRLFRLFVYSGVPIVLFVRLFRLLCCFLSEYSHHAPDAEQNERNAEQLAHVEW